jgi:protein TonB
MRVVSSMAWFLAASALHAGMILALGKVGSEESAVLPASESIELTLIAGPTEAALEVPAVAEPEPIIDAPAEVSPPVEPELPSPPPEPDLPIPEPPPEPPKIEPAPEPQVHESFFQPADRPKPKPASTPRLTRRPIAPSTTVSSAPRPTSSQAGTTAAVGPRTNASAGGFGNPKPPYPPASRQAREEGVVLLRVNVTEQGRTSSVRVMRSSGFARLDESARVTVQRWRFRPGRAGLLPVASEVDVPVRFSLDD